MRSVMKHSSLAAMNTLLYGTNIAENLATKLF